MERSINISLRIIKILISILFYVVRKSLHLQYILLKRDLPGTMVVLTYHSVKRNQRSKFEKHMAEILKTGTIIPANFTTQLKSNRHHIIVTFDDGFQSSIVNALPVMFKRKIPATIFVTTGYLGKKPGWIKNKAHMNAEEMLLSEEKLVELPDDLITIGSHCITHVKLTEVDEDKAIKEIRDSKKTLENILNKSIDLLSFPYGDYNKRILEIVKHEGYASVFLNVPIFPASKAGDFLIGRIDVSLDDWDLEYRLKISGAYQWLPFAIAFKKTLLSLIKIFMKSKKRDKDEGAGFRVHG